MHSLKGAYSETYYIYGAAVRRALEAGFSPTILSMGLGLGYVEIMATAMLLRHAKINEAEIESFEILPELREYFRAWVVGGPCPADFAAAYDAILARNAREFSVPVYEIREALKSLLAQSRLRLRDALGSDTEFTTSFGTICFDAFSAKSTPDLWTEEFLMGFLKRAAAPECVLSTYACTGTLKRSLRASGFSVKVRDGFSSKRDSTFAARGTEPLPPVP
jgi:hypothetical protein